MARLLLIVAAVMQISLIFCLRPLELELVREWKQLDFVFPNDRARADAIQKKQFIVENTFPIDVDVDYRESVEKSRIFVTIPRFSDGIPVSLGFIKSEKAGYMIQPYPDYTWHSSHGANCDMMTSIVRVAIDECNQLYVLDTGVIGETRKCPPQLLIFNLKTDKLVKRFKFPKSQFIDVSLFITPVVDVSDPGRCANTKVYIADVTGNALIVYDSLANKSWRVQNKLFYPYPNYGTFTIMGESFDLMDGLFGLAISPKKSSNNSNNAVFGTFNKRQNERSLYFHSLASGTENFVPLRIINNATLWEAGSANTVPREFQTIGMRGVQTAAEAMDSNGNLFFVVMDPLALVCWDSSTPYSSENIKIVVQNDMTLQFASGLKIIKNLDGVEEIWILTNRFQKIMTGTMSPSEVNYRIQVRTVNQLLNGNSKCNGRQLNANFLFPQQ